MIHIWRHDVHVGIVCQVTYVQVDLTAAHHTEATVEGNALVKQWPTGLIIGRLDLAAHLLDAAVLPDEVVHVGLGVSEVHLVHAEALEPVEKQLARKSRAEQVLPLSEEVLHLTVDFEQRELLPERSLARHLVMVKVRVRVHRIRAAKPVAVVVFLMLLQVLVEATLNALRLPTIQLRCQMNSIVFIGLMRRKRRRHVARGSTRVHEQLTTHELAYLEVDHFLHVRAELR